MICDFGLAYINNIDLTWHWLGFRINRCDDEIKKKGILVIITVSCQFIKYSKLKLMQSDANVLQ